MDKVIWLLIVILYIVQLSSGLECDRFEKLSRAVLLEWPEFPKGRHPDFYIITYHLKNDLIQKNVKSVSTTQLKAQNFTIQLEEDKKHDVMIQSVKDGIILHAISFKTRGISGNLIKTAVTSTSILFKRSISAHDFSIEISYNNIYRILKHNESFYEWTDLRPATLYTFTLEFKQLHMECINVSQTLEIQVETGLCSYGWTAFRNSCYKISKESKPWSVAQKSCGLLSIK
ncbi:uncharacterized protein LOC128327434 [Hemicordylus capensis]|uniref:uncharacterized protein LOC128327434 n=1 Tax=Hemicordylus capensis TaxID=884348 RepID=UPI0023032E60|nr:uncharacterized protein LOC128327434 [Hemicordylus capensis]